MSETPRFEWGEWSEPITHTAPDGRSFTVQVRRGHFVAPPRPWYRRVMANIGDAVAYSIDSLIPR